MNKKIIFPFLCAFLLAGCNSNNNSNSGSNNSNSQVMSIDDNLKTLLEGNLELNGSYTKTGTKHQLNVSFYNNTYVLKDTSDEAILVDKYVKKNDGIYKETVTKNNDLTYKLVDSNISSWNRYENPFKDLNKINISKYGPTRYNISGNNLQQILQIVSGWTYQVKSMCIDTSPKPQLIIDVDGKLDGNITFTFDLATATKEFDIKYDSFDKADVLAQAVEDIYKNYTITDVTHINGQDDTTKVYYRTEDVFFSSYVDNETTNYGYAFKNDGIYSFNVENGLARNVTLFNDDSSKEINFRLDFDMSWDLFKYDVTNEIYVTKDKNAASLLAESFAYDYDTYVEFSEYATSIEVKLSGNTLDYYVVNGLRAGQSFNHKITVSNIGSTSQPFDVSSIDNNREDLSKIKEVYFGTYKGKLVKGNLPNNVTDLTLVINATKVTLNDKEAIVKSIKYYEDKYIHAEFVWEGMELFFAEHIQAGDAGKSLEIGNNDFTIISNELTKQTNELEKIEGKYQSDYFFSMDDNRDDLHVDFTIKNNMVTLNVPDSTLDGLHNVSFNYVGKTSDDKYEFKNETYGSLFILVDSELYVYYNVAYNEDYCVTFDLLNPITKVEIPSFLTGTYLGSLSTGSINGNTSLEIVITTQSVTINSSITTLISYDSTNGIKISINNVNFLIKSLDTLNPTNKISLISEDSSISGTEFTRKGSSTSNEIPTSLIATWKNEETTFGDNYVDIYTVTIKITATNLTINSENKKDACLQNQVFNFVEVSELNGDKCYVFSNDIYGNIKILDYGRSIVVYYETAGIIGSDSGEFVEVEEVAKDDLSSLVGTWESNDSYDLNNNSLDYVRVVITSDGSLTLSSSSSEAYLNKTLTFVKFDESKVAYFVDGEGNQMTIDGVSFPGSLFVTYLAGGLTGEETFK